MFIVMSDPFLCDVSEMTDDRSRIWTADYCTSRHYHISTSLAGKRENCHGNRDRREIYIDTSIYLCSCFYSSRTNPSIYLYVQRTILGSKTLHL